MGNLPSGGILRIGIDARWIFNELSGIGMYTRELIRHLAILDKTNHYLVFFNNEVLKNRTISETDIDKAENFKTCILPYGLFSLKNQLLLPRVLAEERINVFHSTNYMIPLRAFPANRSGSIRCVTTIHDLVPMIFPEYAPRSRKNRIFPIYCWLMRNIAKRSDIIITDSQCSRNDVILHLHIAPEKQDKVLVVHVGVSSQFRPAADNEPGANKGAERPAGTKIILWVGRPDPYKNLIRLIEAFAKLRKEHSLQAELRLVGPQDERYPEARQCAIGLGVQDAVTWVGYVPDEQLIAEYQNADVFVLPSLYEGFGLPAVEAFACGTPVICSNKGSLPEVAGNAALQIQPDDVIGLAEAMKRVLTDDRMAKDMIAKGFQQASKFTWQQTAGQTLASYKRAME